MLVVALARRESMRLFTVQCLPRINKIRSAMDGLCVFTSLSFSGSVVFTDVTPYSTKSNCRIVKRMLDKNSLKQKPSLSLATSEYKYARSAGRRIKIQSSPKLKETNPDCYSEAEVPNAYECSTMEIQHVQNARNDLSLFRYLQSLCDHSRCEIIWKCKSKLSS